jgi:hypothetical protein
MDFEAQLDAIRILIGQNRIYNFSSIFLYLNMKPLAIKAGIAYPRFQYIVKYPSSITSTETSQIARALDLDPDKLEKLLW